MKEKLNIPKIKIEVPSYFNDYHGRLWDMYYRVMQSKDGQEVINFLSNDLRVKALKGRMVLTGQAGDGFDVEKLAMWFLWRSNESGCEIAKQNLEDYLNAEEKSIMAALWIYGVEVDNPIILNDGFIIYPLADMPDSGNKEFFMSNNHHIIYDHTTKPKCAITKICKIKKSCSEEEFEIPTYNQKYSELFSKLYDIACILNVIKGVYCHPCLGTSYDSPESPFGPFLQDGGRISLYDTPTRNYSKLNKSEIGNISELLSKYFALNNNDQKRIKRALERLSLAKRGLQNEDKILDLCIALEMLLLSDNINNDQIRLSFRLRGSWLIGVDANDRLDKDKKLREIYDFRCSVAHSGMLKNQKEEDKLRENLAEYISIAESICQKIIKNGTPDWSKLILGAS